MEQAKVYYVDGELREVPNHTTFIPSQCAVKYEDHKHQNAELSRKLAKVEHERDVALRAVWILCYHKDGRDMTKYRKTMERAERELAQEEKP